jgi:hypothetical protein
MRILTAPARNSHMLRKFAALVVLSGTLAYAADLVFLAEAVNPGNGFRYKAYLDKSTIHREGRYQTVKLISTYAEPIRAAGYEGVKSMVNTFQVDCIRQVKRVTYIAFLNSDGEIIVDEKYPDADDEPIGKDTVDAKTIPYLCKDSAGQ